LTPNDRAFRRTSYVSPDCLGHPRGGEWLVIGIIAVILFGKRLPEVGRSLGKGIIEFKKGLKGIEEDIDVNSAASAQATPAAKHFPSSYKFAPESGEPIGAPVALSQETAQAPQKPAFKFDPYTGQPLSQEQPQRVS